MLSYQWFIFVFCWSPTKSVQWQFYDCFWGLSLKCFTKELKNNCLLIPGYFSFWKYFLSLPITSTMYFLSSREGCLSSTATSVQHPLGWWLGWCDGCHRTTAPVRSPHTSYRWRGESVIEASVWGLLGGHVWQGPVWEFGQDTGVTPLLFYEKCHGIFNDHRESGPRFNVSSESVPVTILGH